MAHCDCLFICALEILLVTYLLYVCMCVCGHRFHRERKDCEVVYDVSPATVNIQTNGLTMNLHRRGRAEILAVEISFVADSIFRLKIKPTGTARQRYEIPVGDVLVSEPTAQK